jgi:hypothetical protein
MKYRNLILGCGYVESATIAQVIVASAYEYDSPKELLQAFRDCLMEAEKEVRGETKEGVCSTCDRDISHPEATYCAFCGSRLIEVIAIEESVAARFADWFREDMNGFTEWEAVHDRGWYIGILLTGGYVQIQGFERYLEHWNPEDHEDHLGEGRSWWDSAVLNEITTGEVVRGEEEDEAP